MSHRIWILASPVNPSHTGAGVPHPRPHKPRTWGHRYPRAGYGGFFRRWLADAAAVPHNSFGNGLAVLNRLAANDKEIVRQAIADAASQGEVIFDLPQQHILEEHSDTDLRQHANK